MKLYYILLIALTLSACGDQNSNYYNETPKTDDAETRQSLSLQRSARLSPRPLPLESDFSLGRPSFLRDGLGERIFQPSQPRYNHLKVYHDKENTQLNHLNFEKGLRVVKIEGLDIVLKKGHISSFWETLNQQNDIKKLRIDADVLTVSDPIYLPSTNLEIYAREIRFTGDGAFHLTPRAYPYPAPDGENGKRGLDAPQATLIAQNIQANADNEFTRRFILKGGDGQDGGAGIDGAPGRSVKAIRGGLVYQCEETQNCLRLAMDGPPACTTHSKCKGRNAWPTSGKDARPGGLPGVAGNGGRLVTNLEEAIDYTLNSAGKIGKFPSIAKGGDAGKPTRAIHRHKPHNGAWQTRTRETSSGKDAAPPAFTLSLMSAEDGEIIVSNEFSHRALDNKSLTLRMTFLDDIYRTNQLERVKFKALEVREKLGPISEDKKSFAGKRAYNHALQILRQLEARLNYYGEPLHSVPHLSLEATTQVFKSEIESSFETLYLTNWVQNESRSIDELKKTLRKKQAFLYDQNTQQQNRIKENQKKTRELKRKAALLDRDTEMYLRYLEDLEREIRHEATLNVRSRNRPSGISGAISTLAALSRVVPVGAPTFMAVSNGLNSLLNIYESRNWSDRLREIPTLTQEIGNIDFDAASEDWNQKWDRFRMREFEKLSKQEQFKRAGELAEFASPFSKEVKNQLSKWSNSRVSDNEVQQEIDFIKSQHPRFKEATEKLQELLKRKTALDQLAHQLLHESEQLKYQIIENLILVSKLNDQSIETLEALSPEMLEALKELERRAEDALMKNFHYFVRAYNYRLVRPYTGLADLQVIYEEVKRMASRGDRSITQQDLRKLRALFTGQISHVLNEIASGLPSSMYDMTTSAQFSLSPHELEALSNGQSIYINLKDLNIFSSYQQNLRIKDIQVVNGDIFFEDEADAFGHLDLIIDHVGHSFIEMNDQVHFFTHHTKDESNPFRWGHRFERGVFLPQNSIQRSSTHRSLLASLISSSNFPFSEFESFMQPGATSDLRFELRQGSKLKSVSLENVQIKVTYTFSSKF